MIHQLLTSTLSYGTIQFVSMLLSNFDYFVGGYYELVTSCSPAIALVLWENKFKKKSIIKHNLGKPITKRERK